MDTPVSVLHDFDTIQPSFEPLFERWIRNFTGENIPKGERLEGLNVEVTVPTEKARFKPEAPCEYPGPSCAQAR